MNDEEMVEKLKHATEGIHRIASAILPRGVMPGIDSADGHVDSLTEAIMGVTGGLCKIAEAIETLAESVDGMNQ